MYLRIVTFGLAAGGAAEYREQAAGIAGAFTSWPGLQGKIWLADERRNRFGGVYLFASKEDADRSRSTPLHAGLTGNPGFSDLVIEEFDTLAAPTAVTWPGGSLPSPTATAAHSRG